MVERMVESTSSYSNLYRVVDDNSNPYRTMIMDAIGLIKVMSINVQS